MRYASNSTLIGYNGFNSYDHTQSWESVGSCGIDYDNSSGYHCADIGKMIDETYQQKEDLNYPGRHVGIGIPATADSPLPYPGPYTAVDPNRYQTFPTDHHFQETAGIVLSDTFPSAMIEEDHHKEEGIMSFVGMMLCEDRIIAFGDTKPTIRTVLGTHMEDVGRGKICKVFSQENFMLATYGANQFSTKNNGHQALVHIEDWMDANIGAYNDYRILLTDLSETMISDAPDSISFIIGSHDDAGLYVRYASVNRSTVTLKGKNSGPGLFTGGWAFYTNRAEEIREMLLASCHTPEEMEDGVRDAVESVISEADKIGSYNPAGLPVNVISWKPDV